MKRFLIVVAAFVAVCILTTSCNNYVCPAYSQNSQQQSQQVDQDS